MQGGNQALDTDAHGVGISARSGERFDGDEAFLTFPAGADAPDCGAIGGGALDGGRAVAIIVRTFEA